MTPPPVKRHILSRIYRLTPLRHKWRLAGLFAGLMLQAAVDMATVGVLALFASSVANPDQVLHSAQFAWVFDHIPKELFPDGRTLIMILSLAAACLVLFKNILTALFSYLNGLICAMIDAFFGDLVLLSFLHRKYEWHLQHNSADLVTIVSWRRLIGNIIIYLSMQTLSDILLSAALTVTLFIAAPYISLAATGVLGLTATFLYLIFRPYTDRIAKRYSEKDLTVNRHVTKALHGIKDVKIFGREQPFMRDYRKEVHAFALAEASIRLLTRSPAWILETAGFLMLAAVMVIMIGPMNASTAKITGTLALLAVSAWRIIPAVSRILSNASAIRQNYPQASRVLTYVEEAEQEAPAAFGSAEPPPMAFEQAIAVENLTFQYAKSSQLALDHIGFTIRKGQTIGIVGRSGAGKSTMVDLLIALLFPTDGRILVDGVPIDRENARSWMANIGYVSQAPYIFDASLAENIAFGLRAEEIDRERVLATCRQAAISDFLGDMPDGIDTLIGERGARLSGGQRQRVAIARALYRKPSVLVFDEATSALDNRSEEAIQKTLMSLSGQLTIVIIAHRLSTVEDCDQVIWLDHGRLMESGPARTVIDHYQQAMQDQCSEV